MSTIVFTVPGTPVAKGRPRATTISGRARMFTPAKTARYESTVALAAQQAMGTRTPFDGPLVVDAVALFDVPASWSQKKRAAALAGEVKPTGRPDLDNIAKALGDGCNGVLWTDDSRIVQLTIAKRYAEAPGLRVVVTATEQHA